MDCGAGVWRHVTPFFLLTQVIILGLGVLLLSASLRAPLAANHFPLLAPLSLIALVLLQILPIPAFPGLRVESLRYALAGHTGYTLSVAPYQSVSYLLL